MSERQRPLWAVALLLSAACAAAAGAEKPLADTRPPVLVAYFVTSDRKPIPGYVERFDRVMTEVQRFYREGMKANGYGPMTFRLGRTDKGELRVHVVQARKPMKAYGRNASAAVRNEVRAALARQGVTIDGRTTVIFQTLLAWEGSKAIEIGPYCGGGNHLGGTAWVFDDERLDPRELGSKKPGGYYHRPCSIGQFNTHYIGGVVHELGHALSLPHVCERKTDRGRGKALMGGGNHTYGQEQRGQGPGAFLNANSAMLLSTVRPFAGDLPGATERPTCTIANLKAMFDKGVLTLTGRVTAKPAAFGISAYDDLERIPGNYDGVGWTCKVGDDGRFRLGVGEMRRGRSRLNLRVCHVNGATSRFGYDYEVDATGAPDVDMFGYAPKLGEAVRAYVTGNGRRADSLAREVLKTAGGIEIARRKAEHLRRLINPAPLRSLADVPKTEKTAAVSGLTFRTATVGWGRPMRNQVPADMDSMCFLAVGREFYESGLYAHAPARFVLDPGGAWKRLVGGVGLQDGNDGSVVFVVRGDDKELFRSKTVKDHRLRTLDVDVTGVKALELVVENAGDGNTSDWGVWIAPELRR